MEREKFSSRLGFILLSAGCAIGLGNIWKFPFLAAKYGGALFILIYLAFLVVLGIPVMLMELSIGRASGKSIVSSFETLKPDKKIWKSAKFLSLGNYLLMAFYVPVSGWFIYYLIQSLSGNLNNLTDMGLAGGYFGAFVNGGNQSAILQIVFALIMIVGCFSVCGLGLKKGVEKITKYIMLGLFALIIFMVIYSLTLSGAKDALKAYIIPSIDGLKNGQYNVFELISAAMGQAFFTLGLGIGSIGIFGSYLDKKRSLLGETIRIVILDTSIALLSGLIIFPALYTYNPGGVDMSGPPLIFIALSSVFANMAQPFGQIFGSLFFLFMSFAAISTVIAVFENIVSIVCDHFNISRKKSCIINGVIMAVIVLPCIFGFSHLSESFNPLGAGTTIQDLEDFILSYNLLPIGCLLYALFCGHNFGWGYENFESEINAGEGKNLPKFVKPYIKYILPVIIVVLFIFGYLSFFA